MIEHGDSSHLRNAVGACTIRVASYFADHEGIQEHMHTPVTTIESMCACSQGADTSFTTFTKPTIRF